jgi:hypothetical protein
MGCKFFARPFFMYQGRPMEDLDGKDDGPCLCMYTTDFFKKGVKKIKFEKRCRFGKFQKIVPPARSTGGRRGAGHLPPIQRAGGAKSFSRPLPRVFLFAKRSLSRRQRHPARPTGGRCPTFLFFVQIYILQTI